VELVVNLSKAVVELEETVAKSLATELVTPGIEVLEEVALFERK
jgi:hypothetical protein